MTDAAAEAPVETKKSSKIPIILGLIVLILGAAGGFYASFSGTILGPKTTNKIIADSSSVHAMPDVTFVEIEPMIISILPASQGKHLRFRANLEVPSQYADDVQKLMPRVINIMNGYLRALDITDLEKPAILTRLRAQLLRRLQIIVGPEQINDVLILEFVIN